MTPTRRGVLLGTIAAMLAGHRASRSRPAWAADADVPSIVAALKHDFEKPDHPLAVSPVVVSGDWALAGWTQGDMGGRALLRRRDGAWVIWLCAGDRIVAEQALRDAGIDQATARRLERDAKEADTREGPERVAMFGRFQGVVPMASDRGEARK